jgi:hypothetical protein
LNVFFLPYLALGMIFSGSYEFVFLIPFIWILVIIFIPLGCILILIGLASEPRNIVIGPNQNLSYQSNSNVRDSTSEICLKCGKKVPHDSNMCPYCGGNFKETNKTNFCPKCGVELDGNPYFCFRCGYKLR